MLECATFPVPRREGHIFFDAEDGPFTESLLKLVDELGVDHNLPIRRIYGGNWSGWQRMVNFLLNGHAGEWDSHDDDYEEDWDPECQPILCMVKALLDRGAESRVELPAFLLTEEHVARWVEDDTADVAALLNAVTAGEMNY